MPFLDNQLALIDSILEEEGYLGFKNNRCYIQGRSSIAASKLAKSLVIKVLDAAESDGKLLRSLGNEKQLFDNLYEYLKEIVYEAQVPQSSNAIFEGITPISSLTNRYEIYRSVYSLGFIEPYVGNLDKGKMPILVYDTHRDYVIRGRDIDYDRFLQSIGHPRKELEENYQTLNEVCPIFDPYSIERFSIKVSEQFGIPIPHINLYNPPTWMKRNATPRVAKFFKDLIDHLFIYPVEREYVYLWLKTCIVGRNHTVLYLRGARAIGKTLLSKVLAKLVGKDYFAEGKKENISRNFNNVFSNNRVVVFEEVHFEDEKDAIDRLKALCNDTIAIEKKGKDTLTEKNYSSIIFCVNKNRKSGITTSERRFSIPKMTEVGLQESIPSKILEKYGAQLEKRDHDDWFEQELAEFGQYLIQFESSNFKNTIEPLRGEAFQECCEENLKEWQKDIIRYILEEGKIGQLISFDSLIKATRAKKRPGRPVVILEGNVTEFVSDYLYKSKYRLGEVVGGINGDEKYNKEYFLIPNQILLEKFQVKKELEETDDLFNLL